MLRPALPLAFLLAASCGTDSETPAPGNEQAKSRAAAQAGRAAEPAKPERPREASGDPAAMLRRYYALIEAGDYPGAWAMRSGDKAGLERFSANFRSYDRYRATVGQPSEPVESGGWAYVEVPVMITGRIRGGDSFASAGSVSIRRATSAPGATARQREWHIYTGG